MMPGSRASDGGDVQGPGGPGVGAGCTAKSTCPEQMLLQAETEGQLDFLGKGVDMCGGGWVVDWKSSR